MDSQIHKLYEEHNKVWQLCCDILEKNIPLKQKRAILMQCYEKELVPHFKEEERMFKTMKLTPMQKKNIPEIIRQHRVLSMLFNKIRKEKSSYKLVRAIKQACKMLKAHIRFEEGTVMEHNEKNPHRLPYSYPDAGISAPKLVSLEIERYRTMSDEYKRVTPLLYHLLGSGTQNYKMAKQDVSYLAESPVSDQRCGNCEFAYKKVSGETEFICSQVAGDITPEAWCRLWKK